MDDILDTRFEGKEIKLSDNRASVGDEINLTAKEPGLRKLLIGVGWDLNAFDADALDVDVSLFLLNKDGLTRVDEDFVFYNNPETLDGAIKHTGDSRTGAGDGDDESIVVDLQGVPFDVWQICVVLSIYRGDEKEQRMGQIQNAYLRLANFETAMEIVRVELAGPLEDHKETAMVAGCLNREGPKWHFLPKADFVEGGLAEAARNFGCVIVQS